MAPTILIVEDEQDLANTVHFALQREGWRTLGAPDGRTALAAISGTPRPDLILLDLMLPDMSGTDICRQVRADGSTKDIPIIMVTAKDEEIDRVVGFEVGADDYVAKPFSMRELLLRVKAILRRTETVPQHHPSTSFNRLRVDYDGHRVWVDRDEIALTALEFRLLSTFLTRAGRVQSRDALLHDVWGHVPGLPTRTVDTHVQRLRKKLGPVADYIETLRGVGYRFREPQDASTGLAG